MSYTAGDMTSFVQNFMSYAKRASAATGGSASPAEILAQWGQETGWGKSLAGNNNYAGIKTTSGSWQIFQSMDDFINTYVTTIKNDILNRNGASFVDKVKNGIYEGSDPAANAQYAYAINSILSSADFQKAVQTSGGSSVGNTTTTSQQSSGGGSTSPSSGLLGGITDAITTATHSFLYLIGGAVAIGVGVWLMITDQKEE